VDKSDKNQPIAFLSQKRDGKADKNHIIYIPAPGSYDVYKIFTSANGNGLWDLSPSTISFRNNHTLLIQTEQTRRVMLYHLKLNYYWEGLHPAALRLVNP
jgi:hypothetical protein